MKNESAARTCVNTQTNAGKTTQEVCFRFFYLFPSLSALLDLLALLSCGFDLFSDNTKLCLVRDFSPYACPFHLSRLLLTASALPSTSLRSLLPSMRGFVVRIFLATSCASLRSLQRHVSHERVCPPFFLTHLHKRDSEVCVALSLSCAREATQALCPGALLRAICGVTTKEGREGGKTGAIVVSRAGERRCQGTLWMHCIRNQTCR